jgi:GWxTD domain-containing protein
MSRGRCDARRRRPVTLLLAVTLGAALAAGCGPTPPLGSDPLRDRLPLEAWVSISQDPEGGVRPGVSVAVPYRSLIFREADGGLVSGLQVQVVALRGEQQVGGGVAEAEVRVRSHAEADADTELVVTAPLRVRGEQPVALQVRARVLASQRTWRRRLDYAPATLAAMPVWIARVETGLPLSERGGRLLESGDQALALTVGLRRREDAAAWPAGGVDLISEVTAPSLESPRRRDQDVVMPAGTDTLAVTLRWPVGRLPFGRCRVALALQAGEGDQRVRLPREPALEVVNLAIPFAEDRAWRRHLQWLSGRLPEAVRDSLARRPGPERPTAWRDLWAAIAAADGVDPAAAERQHLWRIVTADDRFGSFGRGALSDRGRVYIRWGEPARVETFADPHVAGAVWQVWVYPERGRRVLFYDAHGFGDFRLRREEPLL